MMSLSRTIQFSLLLIFQKKKTQNGTKASFLKLFLVPTWFILNEKTKAFILIK